MNNRDNAMKNQFTKRPFQEINITKSSISI